MASSPPRKPTNSTTAKKAKPSPGFLHWLGRQVGHVKKAVQTDVPTAAGPKAPTAGTPADAPQPAVLYRNDKVEEVDHPTQPGVKLRRTIIDEIVATQPTDPPAPPAGPPSKQP